MSEGKLYLLDKLGEMLGDNSKGLAAHSKVIALILLILLTTHTVLQLDLDDLRES